nr:metal-dependent transcriptional regulator [Desulfobulbaceae bacterium]
MPKDWQLSENLEDYLEVILELEKSNKVARAKDIAERIGVQSASVTGALKTLDKKGLINYEPYSFVTLTSKGAKIAKQITRNHNVLENFLINVLQIDHKTANETACRMEHAITEEATERLVAFIDFIYNCPKAGEGWIQSFIVDCAKDERDWQKCTTCIETCNKNHLGTTEK